MRPAGRHRLGSRGNRVRRTPWPHGYRVVPERVEFWQGGADRLHDRLRFVRDDAEGGGWLVQRLAP